LPGILEKLIIDNYSKNLEVIEEESRFVQESQRKKAKYLVRQKEERERAEIEKNLTEQLLAQKELDRYVESLIS
jgi:hypothetical protein